MLERVAHLLARLWWPRRIASVLVLLSVAWSLRDLAMGLIPPWWVVGVAVVQVIAAAGLWYRHRWAWVTTLLLQPVLLLVGLQDSPRAVVDARWWLLQLPHVMILALLLLPEGRRSRASMREPGFEPGDTTPAG